MNVWEGYNGNKKVVSFDTQDRLDDKIDKPTSMMNKLTAHGSSQNKLLKPKIYQGKRRGQTRNNYNHNRYQGRYRSKSGDKRIPYRGRAQYRQNYRESHSIIKIIEVILEEEISEECKITEVKILLEDIEVVSEMIILEEVGVGLEKDNIQVTLGGMIEAVVGWD